MAGLSLKDIFAAIDRLQVHYSAAELQHWVAEHDIVAVQDCLRTHQCWEQEGAFISVRQSKGKRSAQTWVIGKRTFSQQQL